MVFKNKLYFYLFILIICSIIFISTAQLYNHIDTQYETKRIVWCTISIEEQTKCKNFAMAVERDKITIGRQVFKVQCKHAFNKEECMSLLSDEKVTLTTLDAGEVFTAGRFHSLVPIAQEITQDGRTHYYSVAVTKANTLNDVSSLHDLKGKKGCFPGVGTMAGWALPVYTLMKSGAMEIVDCNNHVKSATEFFGPSCAVNALIDKNNPIGDNSDKLCRLCIGKVPGGKCTNADPYADYQGAFKCLLEEGEIAFLKHTTVEELVQGSSYSGLSTDIFELLCTDGTRRKLHDYQSCNWGTVPTNAIVASSATTNEDRRKFQKFLKIISELYTNSSAYDNRNYKYDDVSEYDSFGNRQRVKRQGLGNFGNRNEQFGSNDRRYDQTSNNPYDTNRYDQPNENSYADENSDPLNRDRGYYKPDNFPSINPYDVNRNKYGFNIDPYGSRSKDNDVVRDDRIYNYDFDDNSTNRSPVNTTYYEVFNLFESIPRYGHHKNLLFQDSTRKFRPIDEDDRQAEDQQTYTAYLGKLVDVVMGIRACPISRMTLCVTSTYEYEKCVKMKAALKAQLLKPEMSCYKAHSQINCMEAVQSGVADVAVFDAGDIYTAGLKYDLIPFLSEVYNLGEPEYYVVAVAKEADPDTELTYLRGKYTCHGGINTAAGWIYPMAYLLSNGWIRPYGCNSIRAAAEYFTKSCIPGALSIDYNTGVPYDNMCDLCHGSSFRYCRRDASEVYYGHTGAFRCLVEGGGHVAFVKHTTAMENTGGKRREWWARDALADDFELLCPDGTRAEIYDYAKCNLGKVKANAVVTRGGYGYNDTQLNAYINLFLYAQTFYGSKIPDEFSFGMFYSTPPYTDLIFQDAATQLKVIELAKQHYSEYLGDDFLRAKRIVDCYASAYSISSSTLMILISSLMTFLITLT